MGKIIVGVALLVLPTFALAHGTVVAMAAASCVDAGERFEAAHAAQLKDFVGIKAWPNGAQMMVKVILTNPAFVQYACDMVGQNMVCKESP